MIEHYIAEMNTPTNSPEMTGILMMPPSPPRLRRQTAMYVDETQELPVELPLKEFLESHSVGLTPEKECLRTLATLRKKLQDDLMKLLQDIQRPSAVDDENKNPVDKVCKMNEKINKIDDLVICLLSSN